MRIQTIKNSMGYCLTLLLLGSMLALASCTKEPDGQKEEIKNTATPEVQTEDLLTVKSTLKTYVVPGEYSGLGQALLNRMEEKTTTLDGSVEVIVLQDDYVLSNQDYHQLIDLMVSGGSLVYLKPTLINFETLVMTLGLAVADKYENGAFEGPYNVKVDKLLRTLESLTEGGAGQIPPFFEDDGDTNDVICEAVGISNGDFCILKDLYDQKETKGVITSFDADGNQTEKEVENWTSEEALSPYKLGAYADIMTEWLNDQSEYKATQKALNEEKKQLLAQLQTRGGDDLTSYLNDVAQCQVVRYSFYADMPVYYAPRVPVTTIFKIWAVYSPKENSDYYLIRQETVAQNDKANCGPQDASLWYPCPGFKEKYGFYDDLVYGPYMSKLAIENNFVGGNAVLEQVSPKNDISGSSSYTEGFNWSLNAGIFASSSPAITAGGSVGFSESWTTNISDLTLSFRRFSENPRWTYQGVRPETHFGYNTTHDKAKPILINDCAVGQCWIWKVPVRASSEVFSMESTVGYDSEILGFDMGFLKTYPLYYTTRNVQKQTIRLTPPPRAIQRWQMDCSPYTTKLDTFLERNYGIYWRPYFALNVPTDSDRTAIDASADAFIACLENSRAKWAGAGYSGKTFVFTWKLENSPDVVRTFEFKIP